MEVFVAQAGSHRALNNQQCDRRIFNSSTSRRREASKTAQGKRSAPLGMHPIPNAPPRRARIEAGPRPQSALIRLLRVKRSLPRALTRH